MKTRMLCAVMLVLMLSMLLSACETETPPTVTPLPEPAVLYGQIAEKTTLPAMVTLTADELYDVIGIDPAWYSASAAYFAADGTAPDEILIFLAVDEAAAESLVSVLGTRLQYKQDSASQYLTENQPMLESGVVRRDGLTVSLLVAADMDAVEGCYPE
ncbi:MAG: DUF4358 domain-containing protein [Ruminococcaceae bacterium]|nr:DUF4358 domain-containing protein [Oscillospiraceae bacterium]